VASTIWWRFELRRADLLMPPLSTAGGRAATQPPPVLGQFRALRDLSRGRVLHNSKLRLGSRGNALIAAGETRPSTGTSSFA
jgi:hypothetical protein